MIHVCGEMNDEFHPQNLPKNNFVAILRDSAVQRAENEIVEELWRFAGHNVPSYDHQWDFFFLIWSSSSCIVLYYSEFSIYKGCDEYPINTLSLSLATWVYS